MSQHIQHHHPQQPQYVHYTPPGAHLQQQHAITHVAPSDTQRQPVAQQQQQQHPTAQEQQQQQLMIQQQQAAMQQQQQQHHIQQQHLLQQLQQQQQQAQASTSTGPLIATGDWTKDLVHLAKTAELKKHALTLQLHTAHILSAHASLEQKGKAIQDLREQKNKLESERTRLLTCLRDLNSDRDKVDLMESTLEQECQDTRAKIQQLTDGDYAIAKADVDRLRQELGQPALPSLQSTLDEKTSQYLNERRLSGNEAQTNIHTPVPGQNAPGASTGANANPTPNTGDKRSVPAVSTDSPDSPAKRPRGRPKGSKNKSKADGV